MRTADFEYELPPERIAQNPPLSRDGARLLVVHRATGLLEHKQIRDLPAYLKAGDAVVVNDTRVIPARLLGVKEGTGGRVELLLLEEYARGEWDVLMRSSRRPQPGARMYFGGGRLQAVLIEDGAMGRARVRFETGEPFFELLEEIGLPPLPPYILRKERNAQQEDKDQDRYQTVYAREPGAVAAPTAGLHFTPDLLNKLDNMGLVRVAVTLHVGLGTFRPVSSETVEEHIMEAERYHISAEAADRLRRVRAARGRILAVGSTSVRTLETVMQEKGHLSEAEGRSALFIYPPYEFRAVDLLLTNFHLPRSTLLMMVCAFGGQDLILSAYRAAVREKYRFYSYGDAMLIL